MRRPLLLAALTAAAALGVPTAAGAQAGDQARLLGRAVLPAATFAPGPPSGTLLGTTPVNGITPPFAGQPVQGFSAALPAPGGRLWVMADNGFGAIENSSDFRLRVYLVRPELETARGGAGTIDVERFIELRDPRRKVPFAIVNHFTRDRVLTGADFDVESMQRAPDGTLWFGDEFGPFLLHTDAKGRVLDPPFRLPDADAPGKEIRAPQNPYAEESTPLRIANALKTDAGGRAPVISPDANLIADGDPATGDPARGAPPAGSGLAPASSELFDVALLQEAGFSVVPYTVNDPDRMRALIDLGVDGLISDRPDLLRQVVEEEGVDEAAFDLQGHRGARNLRPENTLPAMEAALDQRVTTLETDTGITADGVPVLAHDPYVEAGGCRRADGDERAPELIRDLTLREVQEDWVCDEVIRTGTPQTNDRALSPVAVAFAAEQELADAYTKPTLAQLFAFAEFYADWYRDGPGKDEPGAEERAAAAGRVRFNVETKLNPRSDRDAEGVRYDRRTVGPVRFAREVLREVVREGLEDRADVQSFDLRTLRVVHRLAPEVRTVALFGDFPVYADASVEGSDDGTNLQPQPGEANTRWLAGLRWPYRSSAVSTPFRAGTSGGFEGMALTPDGTTLLPLLEKPLAGDGAKTLRFSAFDLRDERYTGERWGHELDARATAIGDFQVAEDGRTALVLERDGTGGDLGGFKTVEEVELTAPGTTVPKRRAADLLRIADPDGISLPAAPGDVGLGNPFGFPFETIEGLVVLDDRRVVVLNDNNFPFSSGRHAGSGRPDDGELIVLRLPRATGG